MIEGLLGGIGQGLSNFMGGFGGGGANMPGVTDDERKYLQQQSMQNFGRMLMVLGQQMTPAQRAQAMSQMAGNMPDPTQQLARMQEMKLNQLKMEQYKKQQEGLANFGSLLQQGPQVVETPVPGAAPQQRVPTSGEEARAPLAPITPTQQKLVSPLPGISGEQYQSLQGIAKVNGNEAATDMYKEMVVANQKSQQLPNDYELFQLAQKDPNFAAYLKQQAELKGNKTTIQMPGDTGYGGKLREQLASEDAKNFGTWQAQGAKAGGVAASLEILEELINSGATPQGPVKGRAAQMFPGFADNASLFEAIIPDIQAALRVPGSGDLNAREFEAVINRNAQLRNKPNANKMIVTVMKNKMQIDVDRASLISQFKTGDLDERTFIRELDKLNNRSILTPELRAMIKQGDKSEPATLSNDELLKALGAK